MIKGIVIGVTLVVIAAYFFIKNMTTANLYKDFSIIEYKLEDKNLKLLVADTPEKHQKGLMYYRELEGVDGMIFQFPDSHMRTFWNKNTYMNLKIYWVNDKIIVGTSELPSIEKSRETVTVSSPSPANVVIEIPNL